MARKATRGHLQTLFSCFSKASLLPKSTAAAVAVNGPGKDMKQLRGRLQHKLHLPRAQKAKLWLCLSRFPFFLLQNGRSMEACCIRASVRCRAAFLTHARLTALKPALGTILPRYPTCCLSLKQTLDVGLAHAARCLA